MRKSKQLETKSTPATTLLPVTLDAAALQLVCGGINGGLHRDIIRRKA